MVKLKDPTRNIQRQRPPQTLTEQDRESVKQIALKSKRGGVELAEALATVRTKNEAVNLAIQLMFRIQPAFAFSERGEPDIEAKANGLHASYGSRRGIVRYVELVEECCDFSEPVQNGNGAAKQVERAQDMDGHSARNGHDKSTTLPDGIDELDPEATGTTTEGRPVSGSRRKREQLTVEAAPAGTELLDIMTIAINPNPWQPRKDFSKESIAELAEQLKPGLIHPIAVRLTPGTANVYQLIAGERRLRAAKLLGWPRIAAVVRHYTDQQMQEAALRENEAREGLNPLEIALAYQRILDERKLKPVDLEKITGKSQPYISNHLRLLELPKEWRARVAARELSLTHARALMPWKDQPQILAAVAKKFKSGKTVDASHEEFEESVDDAVCHCTRDLEHRKWSSRHSRYIEAPKFTPEQRAELGIVKVKNRWGGGMEERATNVKLFDQLWRENEKKIGSKEEKAEKRAAAKERTPAQKKANQAKRAKQFGKRLLAWKADWIRYLVGRRLAVKGVKADDVTVLRVILWATMTHGWSATSGSAISSTERSEHFAEAVKAAGGKVSSKYYVCDEWATLLAFDDGGMHDLAADYAKRLFWDKVDKVEQPIRGLPDDAMFTLAKKLGLNLAAEWKAHQAGPLTEGYYNLHDTEPLRKIFREIGGGQSAQIQFGLDRMRKAEMVEKLLSIKPNKMPAEIAAAKEPK